jgi:hypothetical protein
VVTFSFAKLTSDPRSCRVQSENYAPPEIDSEITTVGIGLDGTCMLMCEEGWREATVGTILL